MYILGAGFSRYAGAPLIADYIDKIRQYWEDPKSTLDRDERERFKHFLDYQSNLMSVRNKININLGNIEELLGLAEMEVEWGGSDPSLKDDYIYALLRTLELTTHCYDLGIFNDLSGLRWDSDSRLSKLACYYYSNGHKNSSLVKSIYQIFAHLFMLSPTDKENCPIDTIISFNYDLLLDSALLEVGLGIDYSIIKHSSDSKADEYDNRTGPR